MAREIAKFEEILEQYQLQFSLGEFLTFDAIPPVNVSDSFREELRFALLHRGEDDKEAFTSEFIIVPFLRETWKNHPNLNLFSHVQIRADDLIVIPDYLVSARAPTGYKTVYRPLLLTIEAKDEKFDEGWSQALLQSIVCQKMNQTKEIPIFSIVTIGDSWQFGQLQGELFTKHPFPASIQPIDELLGILDMLFTACENAAAGV